jgi:environmental stress-induced protein Ves
MEWRVSIANIATDVSFSTFPGVSRLLMPLSAGGLTLSFNGHQSHVEPYETISFDGADEVGAVGVTSASRDLNLMTRTGVVHGSLSSTRFIESTTIATAAGEIAVVVNLLAAVQVSGRLLGPGDAVLVQNGEAAVLSGLGRIAIARIQKSQTTTPIEKER